jgi:molecular chaperone DnaK (HSP70)
MSSQLANIPQTQPQILTSLPRRLIGRRYDDPTVKKDIESWPFKIVDQGGNPMVQVEYLNETKTFSPQEISSMVLMKVSPSTPPTEPASNINTLHR